MKERPILFSAPMVRVILEGRKTQTRRVAKFAPTKQERGINLKFSGLVVGEYFTGHPESGHVLYSMRSGCWNAVTEPLHCPYGVPGDRMWLRESFLHQKAEYEYSVSTSVPYLQAHTIYAADVPGGVKGAGFTPGIFMPRNLSRITLEITEVRVQRLQEITAADCKAEGIASRGMETDGQPNLASAMMYIHDFEQLWDSINATRGFGWDKNPWVWAISFRRVA